MDREHFSCFTAFLNQNFAKASDQGSCPTLECESPKLQQMMMVQLLRSLPPNVEFWPSPGCGVCFRMYTEGEAKKIGVVGWVKNTSKGTVTGQVQGPEDKVNSMKSWLSKVGSPSSRIDRTNFSNEKTISKLEYSNFSIRY
ncbi:acylphosphatase-2 isoform X2 [Oryctolagus cuniculus]|uniref:acylphosphatase-2 isoform X2 n=2 Tax=Leporidae TaxID=9979 RepID=UPI00387A401B